MKTLLKHHSYLRTAILCLFVVLLAACINTETLPQNRYYLLDEPTGNAFSFAAPSVDNDNTLIKVNLVTVADFLSQPNLVMKLDNHQIAIANYHIWGEDLPSAIQRVMLKDLNSRYQYTTFVKRCLKCLELSIYVDHFYPTQTGDTIISGSYEFRNNSGNATRHEFMLSTPQKEPGYSASVKNMRLLLHKLADSIEVDKPKT